MRTSLTISGVTSARVGAPIKRMLFAYDGLAPDEPTRRCEEEQTHFISISSFKIWIARTTPSCPYAE